ncbi:MAG: hypothetical protein AAFQ94_00395 [Bacteroidota bacterium]
MQKLTLYQLRIKSFITIQTDYTLLTVKAGALGSDGPPHTSSRHTEIGCNGVLYTTDCRTDNSCEVKTQVKTC